MSLCSDTVKYAADWKTGAVAKALALSLMLMQCNLKASCQSQIIACERALTGQIMLQIGRMGAVAIAKALATCSSLEKLELDENQISEDGVTHLKVGSPASE